jgi:VWFA-related protein
MGSRISSSHRRTLPDSNKSGCVVICFLWFFLICGAVPLVLTQDKSVPSGEASTGAGAIAAGTSNRLVVVDVIATDAQGHPATGLTEDDFQVVEKVGWATQVPQKIESFRVVDTTRLRNMTQRRELLRTPPEARGELRADGEPAAPLTILLLDNLNTDLFAPSVKEQVAGMANLGCEDSREEIQGPAGNQDVPIDPTCRSVPIAVLVLGQRLEMLQDFNADRNLLRATLDRVFGAKSSKTAAADLAAAVAANESLGPANRPSPVPAIQSWNRVPTSGDDRVRHLQMTMDAIRAIARHLAGYPGPKKLIWVSTAFPFTIAPNPRAGPFDDPWSYRGQAATVVNALANARVSLYPARPGLISIQQDSTSTPRMNGQPAIAAPVQANTNYFAATVPMQEFAGQTGGMACLDDKDLATCFDRVLHDGLIDYEITYSPPSNNWSEGFHRIVIRTPRRDVSLSYRRYYYVRGERRSGPDMGLKQAACDDVMTATSLKLTAQLQAAALDPPKFALAVDGKLLTADVSENNRARLHLHLDFGVCAINERGIPLRHVQYPTQQEMSVEEFKTIQRSGVRRLLEFQPAEGTKLVRWVVRDSLSGRLGSVDLPYQALPVAAGADTAEDGGKTDPVASPERSTSSPEHSTIPQRAGPVGPTSAEVDRPPADPDSEINPYCAAVTNGVAHSEALAKLCRFTLSLHRKMPNLISDLETKRNWRAYNAAHRDIVTATVTYEDGQEHYDRIKINGSPAAASSDALNSSWSMGEFASILQMIFSPMSDVEFRSSTEVKLNSIPALLFEFRVEQANNEMYYLHAFYPSGSGTTLFPAYRGKVWLNQSNFQLMRMEKETADMPKWFPITRAKTMIDYADVPLGDGSSFVLPGKSEIEICEKSEESECAHNIVRFRNWHKFGAKSRILSIEDPH